MNKLPKLHSHTPPHIPGSAKLEKSESEMERGKEGERDREITFQAQRTERETLKSP